MCSALAMLAACGGLIAEEVEPARDSPILSSIEEGVDVRERIRLSWSRSAEPRKEFEAGSAILRESADDIDEKPELTRTVTGFEIQFPSRTPIATPAVAQGKLYVGGGFSSMEFHCFEAATGKLLWTVELSDDGPSMPVLADDTLLINTESCTLFALEAHTGEHRWSWYLGDPLLSSPTVANGLVFTVYPSPKEEAPTPEGTPAPPENEAEPARNGDGGTAVDSDPKECPKDVVESETLPYVLICLDLRTGEVQWQRRIESDCMTAPIADGADLFLVTLSGRLYRFRQNDGELLAARDLRATSVPTLSGGTMYLARRLVGDRDEDTVRECFVQCRHDGSSVTEQSLAWSAPYLDRVIQELSDATQKANAAEQSNGIGGGFGGGFGSGSGGGFFQVPPELPGQVAPAVPQPDPPQPESHTPPEELGTGEIPMTDLLSLTQQQAANVIGLGNVSTIQAFQGSRPLVIGDRIIASIGDRVVCLDDVAQPPLWAVPIDGDLQKLGGHLATPPLFAGGSLFVATVTGRILQLSPSDGTVQREWDVKEPIRFAPVVADGRLYAGTQEGKIICLSLGDAKYTGWPMWGRDEAHGN